MTQKILLKQYQLMEVLRKIINNWSYCKFDIKKTKVNRKILN